MASSQAALLAIREPPLSCVSMQLEDVCFLLCRDRGDLAAAHGHFEHAAAQFEASGLTRELETVRRYLAQMG